ncbi:hypothetical protein [Herbaspirillum camelliae]|uniref:hypothetical protein n=1 Tax=Herbaspirillum camelliae TaxID=1892903 RepID=UPI000AFF4FE7|nr:hypothetical protein [Herbaspirillum camelliae]
MNSKRIDEVIKDLQKTKEALHKPAKNLRLANDKAEDLTSQAAHAWQSDEGGQICRAQAPRQF